MIVMRAFGTAVLAALAACRAPAPTIANRTASVPLTVSFDVDHAHGPCRWSGARSKAVFDALVAAFHDKNPGAIAIASDDTSYAALERELRREPPPQNIYMVIAAHEDGGAVYGWHMNTARKYCFEVTGGTISVHEIGRDYTD